MLNVYIIRFDGGTDGDGYGGGMTVVVANTPREAFNIAAKKFNGPDEDPYDEFEAYYATKDAIEEHPELSTDLTEPQVIAFNFYRE